MKRITVADNSGTRRRQEKLHIWRNDITGMEPGSTVEVRFADEYVRNGCKKQTFRKYVVEGIKFDDEYAEKKGRHTVALRRIEAKEKEAKGGAE